MPLMILGLIVLIGVLILQIVQLRQIKRNSNMSTRNKETSVEQEVDDNKKTLYFPTENIEDEKHKRNIH